MTAPISAVYIRMGMTSKGYTLDVTYRCVGEPLEWRYLSLRQLLATELLDVAEASVGVLMPGQQPPAVAGQATLF